MEGLIQILVNGLLLGGIYATMAMGLALTLGVLRVINVAHSAFIVLGAYAAFELWGHLELNPLITGILLAPLFFLLGAIVARVVVEPLAKAHETVPLVALFGVMIMIETALTVIWTGDTRRISTELAGRVIDARLFSVSVVRLLAASSCVAVLLGTHWFLQHRPTGKAVRAMAENRDMATVLGVDVRRLGMIVFGIGTATAAYGGAALSTVFAFTPQVHYVWLAWAFLIVVLGGLGSVRNTLLAGLFVGVAESSLALLMPFQHVYVAMYVGLGIVLLLRTEGLAGVAGRRV